MSILYQHNRTAEGNEKSLSELEESKSDSHNYSFTNEPRFLCKKRHCNSSHLSINSLRSKFDFSRNRDNANIVFICESKLDECFPLDQYKTIQSWS